MTKTGDPVATREIKIGAGAVISEIDTEANGTSGTPALGNLEPAAVTSDNIAKWLKVTIAGDGDYYIPMWT